VTPPGHSAEQAIAGAVAESALLEVRDVSKSFGLREVLKYISLEIGAGEFLTLLGESGSGSSAKVAPAKQRCCA